MRNVFFNIIALAIASLVLFGLFIDDKELYANVVVGEKLEKLKYLLKSEKFDSLNQEFPRLGDDVFVFIDGRFIEVDGADWIEFKLIFHNKSGSSVEFLQPVLMREKGIDVSYNEGVVELKAEYACLITSSPGMITLDPNSCFSVKELVELPNGASKCIFSVSLFEPNNYAYNYVCFNRIRSVDCVVQREARVSEE